MSRPLRAGKLASVSDLGPIPPYGRKLSLLVVRIFDKDVFQKDTDDTNHIVSSVNVSPESIIRGQNQLWSGEYTYIQIRYNASRIPISVTLMRSISSSLEIFFCITSDGELVISDRFDVAMCSVPPHQRTISRGALIDHLLSRTVTGRDTYCEQVERVTHGGAVEIDLVTGAVQRGQFEFLPVVEAPGSVRDYVDRIDYALGRSTEKHRDSVVLFSGGIDSTLLATYAPKGALLQCQISSPEFIEETAYASRSARLLGRPVERSMLDEEHYLEELEDVIDRIGAPPHHAMTVLLGRGFARAPARILVGADADMLFGFGSPFVPLIGMFAQFMQVEAVATFVMRLLGVAQSKRIELVRETAAAMRRPVDDPRGYALGAKRRRNMELTTEIFGADAVHNRLRLRYANVARLGAGAVDTSRSPTEHIRLRHLIGYFTNNSVATWRSLATTYGHKLICPFNDAHVLAVAQSIPARDRFIRRFTTKYLLKAVLRRRLDEYPYNQKKLGGVMPLERFFMEGPLRDIDRRYGHPDFLDSIDERKLDGAGRDFRWHAVTYAIWRKRSLTWSKGEPPSIRRFSNPRVDLSVSLAIG